MIKVVDSDNKNYKSFVDKFKPKLTTDDCYTPDSVYKAVKGWAIKEYRLDGREIVRPFWPGASYEDFDYPNGCVVIDNPPFSILSKIKGFYKERGIDYFLFAPHLTLFSPGEKNGERFIVTNASVIYENGAKVNTSFVTNLEASLIRTAPELKQTIEVASKENEKTKKLPKYKYPHTVISSALLGKISSVNFKMGIHDCAFVRTLDSQRKMKKSIYGAGFFISHGKAAELRAAELRAAELRAAELRAAELQDREDEIEFELSEREIEIINNLSEVT